MIKRLAVLTLMLTLLVLPAFSQGTPDISPDDGRVCNAFDVQEQGDGFTKYFYCCCETGYVRDGMWMYFNCFVEVWTISETEYYRWEGGQCTFDQMPR